MIEKRITQKRGATNAKNFLYVNCGLILIAAGLHFFRNPNKFAMGGVNGLSIVLNFFFPQLPVGVIMLAVNMLLLLVALVFLGKNFVVKTLYCSLALSAIILLFERVAPMTAPLTANKLMELIYAVFLPGIGMALVLESGATTGGTDIIAKIISKYLKLKMSISLMLSDILVVIASAFIFGLETGLYAFMGLMLSSYVVDGFLESLQIRKIIVIISSKSEQISQFICSEINRGATVHDAKGAYHNDAHKVITTVVNRQQARQLQDFIKETDPDAFITITNSSSIIGAGFKKFE